MWFSRSLLFPSLKTLHLPLERPLISSNNILTPCRCPFHRHHHCCLQVLLADRLHSHVRPLARRCLLLGPRLWHLYWCFARLMHFQCSAARPARRLAGRPFPTQLLSARFRTRHVRLPLDSSASSTLVARTPRRPPRPLRPRWLRCRSRRRPRHRLRRPCCARRPRRRHLRSPRRPSPSQLRLRLSLLLPSSLLVLLLFLP